MSLLLIYFVAIVVFVFIWVVGFVVFIQDVLIIDVFFYFRWIDILELVFFYWMVYFFIQIGFIVISCDFCFIQVIIVRFYIGIDWFGIFICVFVIIFIGLICIEVDFFVVVMIYKKKIYYELFKYEQNLRCFYKVD